MPVSKPKSTKWERYILYVREYQLIVVIQLLMVSFGSMISFRGVFMGMIMINELLVVVVIRISLNKIGRNYTLTIRNRSCRYFTLHIFTHCLLSFKRSRCKGYVRFSRIWNIRRRGCQRRKHKFKMTIWCRTGNGNLSTELQINPKKRISGLQRNSNRWPLR